MRLWLSRYFELEARSTNIRTEVLAGVTTFFTMAYIVVVNPAILHDAGMPLAAVAVATCFSAGIGTLLMALFANYPLALAPGMGLNAYFTYTVCQGMGVPWQTALGCVFLSGVAFLVLTAVGLRQLIIRSIPRELFSAVAAGVGLFIAFIGLRNAGIIIPSAGTTVTLGNFRSPQTALALVGLTLTAALMVWRVRAAMLIGILVTTAAGWVCGIVQWHPVGYTLRDVTATAFKLDLRSALHIAVHATGHGGHSGFGAGLLEIIFVFLFVDLFDNIGTLVAVTKRAGLVGEDGHIPRLNRIFFADAVATIAGSLAGTSTVVSYVESSAGVAAGGRTGLASLVTAGLFFATLFVAPLAGLIPAGAIAPALVLVGAMMISSVTEIDWQEPALAIPAFLTLVTIPLTFSVANGLAFGMTSYTLLRGVRGELRWSDWMLVCLSILFVLRFVYMDRG